MGLALLLGLAHKKHLAIIFVSTDCGVCLTNFKCVQKKLLIFVLLHIICVANHALSLNLYSIVARRHALGYSLGRIQSFKSKVAV